MKAGVAWRRSLLSMGPSKLGQVALIFLFLCCFPLHIKVLVDRLGLRSLWIILRVKR